MQIHIASERLFTFTLFVSEEEAESKASAKKSDAFETLNKMASFLSKPLRDSVS
jgi:hypothetical protein